MIVWLNVATEKQTNDTDRKISRRCRRPARCEFKPVQPTDIDHIKTALEWKWSPGRFIILINGLTSEADFLFFWLSKFVSSVNSPALQFGFKNEETTVWRGRVGLIGTHVRFARVSGVTVHLCYFYKYVSSLCPRLTNRLPHCGNKKRRNKEGGMTQGQVSVRPEYWICPTGWRPHRKSWSSLFFFSSF